MVQVVDFFSTACTTVTIPATEESPEMAIGFVSERELAEAQKRNSRWREVVSAKDNQIAVIQEALRNLVVSSARVLGLANRGASEGWGKALDGLQVQISKTHEVLERD